MREFGHLIALMMREEARYQSNFTSKLAFYEFPIVLLFSSFLAGFFHDRLVAASPLPQLLLTLHFALLLYGLSTGAFAFLGKELVDRRFGNVNFLIAAPTTLPVQFKTTIAAFYVKDALYYYAFTLAPVAVGLALATPFAPYPLTSVALLFLAMVLTFSYGLALAYAFSALYLRSRRLFNALALAFIALLVLAGTTELVPIGLLMPSVAFQLTKDPLALVAAAALIVAFSWGATHLIRETFESAETRFDDVFQASSKRFARLGRYAPFVAKEWIDLRRSHALSKMVFSFAVPLVFLSFSIWFLNNALGVSLRFDTVFYAGNVGFFGVMIYSWLNHIDITEYYDTLPVTVPRVVKAKLIVFFIVTIGITAGFVVAMAYVNGEPWKIGLALPVAFATSAYTVVATAYLTGLRTNTYLLSGPMIARFGLLTIPPLLAIAFLSLGYDLFPGLALQWIGIISGAMALSTFLLFGLIDGRWGRMTFQRA
ncbi:MAG TPA: hypothetical protein VGB42_08865 [Candidatus Thermoplasmatota archaeon]